MPPKKPAEKSPGKMTFEEATEELESIIERIEQGEIGLEAALAARKRGDALIKRCREILETATQELERATPEEAAPDGAE